MQKILVIDDHNSVRESLVRALKKEFPGFAFLEAENGAQVKTLLLQNKDCGTVLLDIRVGDEDGLTILDTLRKICPEIRTLVCTALSNPLTIESALKQNVHGFISKTSELKEIVCALKTVAQGDAYYCPEANEVMMAPFSVSSNTSAAAVFSRYRQLSAKEKEVFDLLAQKMDVATIAARLRKSVHTVENQRTAAYAKMNIHDRLEAVEAGKALGIGV